MYGADGLSVESHRLVGLKCKHESLFSISAHGHGDICGPGARDAGGWQPGLGRDQRGRFGGGARGAGLHRDRDHRHDDGAAGATAAEPDPEDRPAAEGGRGGRRAAGRRDHERGPHRLGG